MSVGLRIHALGNWDLVGPLWNVCCKRLMISKFVRTSNGNLWTLYLKCTVSDIHKHRPSENVQLFYRSLKGRGLPTASLWALCSAFQFRKIVSTLQIPWVVRAPVKRHRTCSNTRANATSIYTQHCCVNTLGFWFLYFRSNCLLGLGGRSCREAVASRSG
jgi:hypothetical protein